MSWESGWSREQKVVADEEVMERPLLEGLGLEPEDVLESLGEHRVASL